MAEENKLILDVDVAPLKTQLKNAVKELQAARQKFGEFSEEAVNAAKKVAAIKDEIEDAGEQAKLFDPGKRFIALTNAAAMAASGIAAVQGAMALFGAESDNVQKALLKVQGAMALSSGLSQLKDVGKVTTQLKASFQGLTAGVNGFKKALISTGIGALLVAVGLLVAYWDDIKAAVGGVSKEQKKLNESSKENLKTQEDKLTAIDGQSNQLKLQGKSEKEILNIKIKQSDEAIKAAEINLANAKATKDAQVKAAERNKEILKGIITFLSAPLVAVLAMIDEVGNALGKNFGLAEGFTGGLANMVFDPKETAEEGDKTIKEAEGALNKLKEGRAGYQIAIQGIDKAAADKAKTEQDKIDAKQIEAKKILEEAKSKLKSKQLQEEDAIEAAYAEKFLKLKEAGIKDDGTLEAAKQKEINEIKDKYRKEEALKVLAYENELNKIITETRLAAIKDENEKAKQQLLENYQQQYKDIDDSEKYNAEQKIALKKALQEKENTELNNLQRTQNEQKLNEDLAALDRQLANADLSLQIQKDLLNRKEILTRESFERGDIDEKEYNLKVEANAKTRGEITKKENELKVQLAQQAAAALTMAGDLLGKETAAGKSLAIAGALINTYQGIAAGVKLGFPLAIPAVAMAAMTGFAAVKNILATKVPAKAASTPSVSMSAPAMAQAVPTLGTSPVTAIASVMQNQKPIRAFVVESEVTGTQRRVADIERRAGF
jgi:hypothetical protein